MQHKPFAPFLIWFKMVSPLDLASEYKKRCFYCRVTKYQHRLSLFWKPDWKGPCFGWKQRIPGDVIQRCCWVVSVGPTSLNSVGIGDFAIKKDYFCKPDGNTDMGTWPVILAQLSKLSPPKHPRWFSGGAARIPQQFHHFHFLPSIFLISDLPSNIYTRRWPSKVIIELEKLIKIVVQELMLP